MSRNDGNADACSIQKKIGYGPSFVCFQAFGVFLHIYDLYKDCTLAVEYYQKEEFLYCTLVSLFGLLTPLLVSLLSCIINCKRNHTNSFQNPKWLTIVNVVFHILPLAPVARVVEYSYHAKKCHSESDNSKLESQIKQLKWKNKIQTNLLNVELFFESTTQLLLKNHILFNYYFYKESTLMHFELHPNDSVEGDWITIRFNSIVLGVTSSFLTCAWRLTSNRKSGNLLNDKERHLNKKHISLLFAHHLFSLFARFMLLGMMSALSVRTFWIFCGVHTAMICLILSFQKFYRGRTVFQWKENESSPAQDVLGFAKVILSSLLCLTDFRFKRAFKLHTRTFCWIPVAVNIVLIIYIWTLVPLILHGFILAASLSSALLFYIKCKDLGLDINGTETRDHQSAVPSVIATLRRNCSAFIDKLYPRSFSHYEKYVINGRNSSPSQDAVVVVGQDQRYVPEGSVHQRRKKNKLSYKPEDVIGMGGSALVFQGFFNSSRPVAIKLLQRDYRGDKSSILREIENMQKAGDHPNILKYIHHEITDDFLYIATELCRGTLEDYFNWKYNRPPYKSEKEILLQVTRGLAHLHEKGIVHRNITPTNILVFVPEGNGSNPVMKLAGFGISKGLNPGEEDYTNTSVTNPEGTRGWMAPEVYKSKRLNSKVDIFALGLIFAYTLSKGNKHPFGDDADTRMTRIKMESMTLVQRGLKEPFSKDNIAFDLIKSMLNMKPDDRPAVGKIVGSTFFSKTICHIM